MEFETLRCDMVWRFEIFNMISRNNLIFNISTDIFNIRVSILGLGANLGEIIV